MTLFMDAGGIWAGGTDASAGVLAPVLPAPDLAGWCRLNPLQRARVVVGAALTHDLLVRDADMPIADAGAWEGYVRAQLVQVHGQAAMNWPLALWSHAPTFAASALHGASLPDPQRHGGRLLGLQPWWTIALAVACRVEPQLTRAASAAVWVVEGQLGTWLRLRDGELCGLQRRRLAQARVDDAIELAHRIGHEEAVPMPAVAAMAHGLDRPDWPPGAGLRHVGDAPSDRHPPGRLLVN